MNNRRLVSVDSEGNALYHSFDPETGIGTFQMVRDVAPLINANQAQLNASDDSWKGDTHQVARIDAGLWAKWAQEFGSDPSNPENHARLLQKLNDRDYSKMRVKRGRL